MRRFGFFKELPHGDPNGLSILDAGGQLDERQRIAEYLANASVLFAAPGIVASVAPGCDAELEFHVVTDGEWMWPKDLAHYVRYHGVTLPDAMISHITEAGYHPIPLSREELAALDF